MNPGTTVSYEIIVLAGGAARRLGGQDKPGLRIGGRTLIQRVLAAGREAGAATLIVVGPRRDDVDNVLFVQDEQDGPVLAVKRGLAEVSAPWVALLAADLPFLRARHIGALLRAAAGKNGAVLVDDDGREQWLAGCWRTETLRRALETYQGKSLHGLLAPLGPATIRPEPGEPPPWLDCDTPADVEHARQLASGDNVLG
jgi:molybdopterin-guanine dinucleotide biosynthesis protein A